ncbi:MAG: hypothetical protein ABJF11_03135 [Reichenbachiella sp.]|uniref:hypothetical protein n=1 Tax=Reichenbachiella sp. TaxID=2184521 RepID=UPI0032630296
MLNKLVLIILALTSIGCSTPSGTVTYHPANRDSGFEHPYFLFVPDGLQDTTTYILVEPNNTGYVSNDFEDHREGAENLINNSGNLGNMLARKLRTPLLVPVFPRSETNWRTYTHALDRDVMLEKEGTLRRLDLQLLAMIEEARDSLLRGSDIIIRPNILMTGFSASGTFANRFTALHADKVRAVAAGGINGILMLPTDSLEDTPLNYPLGTADIKELTGKTFDSIGFRETPQMLYMGAEDDNDAASYSDAYDDQERELIYRLLGKKMLPDRWTKCKLIYDGQKINADILTYPSKGHELSDGIQNEILAFFRKHTSDKH